MSLLGSALKLVRPLRKTLSIGRAVLTPVSTLVDYQDQIVEIITSRLDATDTEEETDLEEED